jgi:hypothetical protein
MLELLDGLRAWQLLIVALAVYGFFPGVVLRFILLAFRRSDPRRAEILAELRAVSRWERPFWVAEQAEVALFEGLLERIKPRLKTSRMRSAIPIGPIYFTKAHVRHGLLSKKTYAQGTRGVVLRVHKLLGRPTHVDLRLPDGKFLLEVPIDYIRAEPG